MAAVPETRSALPLPPEESERLRSLRERLAARPRYAQRREAVAEMHQELLPLVDRLEAARRRAIRWVTAVREHSRSRPLAESLLDQFPLDSKQGKALMSLAEALLRTPDPRCADRLIAERLTAQREGGAKEKLRPDRPHVHGIARHGEPAVAGTPGTALAGNANRSLLAPVMAPLVRAALRRGMRMMGHAFIVGESIQSALARGRRDPELSLCSFDVLGEGARSETDAQRYLAAYAAAIEARCDRSLPASFTAGPPSR